MNRKHYLYILTAILASASAGCSDHQETDKESGVAPQTCLDNQCKDSSTAYYCQDGKQHEMSCEYGCVDGRCQQEPNCREGQTKCTDNYAWTCSEAGTWEKHQECEYGCEGSQCRTSHGNTPDVLCAEQGLHCVDNLLVNCNGTEATILEECEDVCDPSLKYCAECVQGMTKCADAKTLLGCSYGFYVPVDQCDYGCVVDHCLNDQPCDCETHEGCTEEEYQAQCGVCPIGKVLRSGLCTDEGLVNAALGSECIWDETVYCDEDGTLYYCDFNEHNEYVLFAEKCQTSCNAVDLQGYGENYMLFCDGISNRCQTPEDEIVKCVESEENGQKTAAMSVDLCMPTIDGKYVEVWAGTIMDKDDLQELYLKHNIIPSKCQTGTCSADGTTCGVECNTDNDCNDDARPYCDTVTNSCVSCKTNDDCGEMQCLAGVCILPCETDSDCGGKSCISNICMNCHEGDLTLSDSDNTLECVNGNLKIEQRNRYTSMNFRHLMYIKGALSLTGGGITEVSMPTLQEIETLFINDTNLKKLYIPSLKRITNDSSYSIGIYGSYELYEINLPQLVDAGGITIRDNSNLHKLLMPSLKNAKADIKIDVTPFESEIDENDYELDFSSLTDARALDIDFPGKVTFPSLSTLNFGIHVNGSDVTSLDFPELVKCSSIEINYNKKLKSINLPKLEEVNFYFDIMNNPVLETLNLDNFIFYSDTSHKGWHIENNASLACSTLCSLKDSHFDTMFSGDETYRYDNLFSGNKADNACPDGGSIQWDKCKFVCEGENCFIPDCYIENETKCEDGAVWQCENYEWKKQTTCPLGCEVNACAIAEDTNHNHLLDQYETASDQGKACKTQNDCTDFCDSFIGNQCSTRCTSNSQCREGYICRPDGRCASEEFVMQWSIPEDNFVVELPAQKLTDCNFELNWGDGTIEKYETCPSSMTHTYAKSSDYYIRIKGAVNNWTFTTSTATNFGGNQTPSSSICYDALKRILSFGNVGIGNYAFYGCSGLQDVSGIDIPDSTRLTAMDWMFARSVFDGAIGNWDTSNVKSMYMTFSSNIDFNQDISSWNTENVENMIGLFDGAKKFNQPIGNWNVSQVTNMSSMFSSANVFNQDISQWDVSKVTDMSNMFAYAYKFNSSLKDWDVSNVTNMSGMFYWADAFNTDISAWDVSKVTTMKNMFNYADSFNQDLSSWNLESVTNVSFIFEGTPLSQQNYCSMMTNNETWKKYESSLGKNYICE